MPGCPNCSAPWTSKNPDKCIFHAEPKDKGVTLSEFHSKMWQWVNSTGKCDFKGFIFPDGFQFRIAGLPNKEIEKEVSFIDARFVGNTKISDVEFKSKVTFKNIKVDGTLLFEDTVFGSSLEFSDCLIDPKKRSDATIIFRGINFPSNATFFRNISSFEIESEADPHGIRIPGIPISAAPVFVFRQCCLEDVYFDGSDMGLFSFLKSSFFENAHIDACTWPDVTERYIKFLPFTTHTRKYVIPEEWLIRESKKHALGERLAFYKKYDIVSDFKYSDVGSIYRRIKTSLDANKAYEEAAWLYYNEIEMRRVAWWEEFYSESWYKRFKKVPPLLWGLIYDFYKMVAGYGERPLNSAISFVLFLFLFASLHLLNGLQFGDRVINYDLAWNGFETFFTGQFWLDWFEGLKYAVLRLVPLGYVPVGAGPSNGAGLGDVLLSLANTTILTLLLIFVGIGLKRHFKRF